MPGIGERTAARLAFFVLKQARDSARFDLPPLAQDLAQALKELLAVQDKPVTIEKIQKQVAAYFKIRVADLLSSRRTRSITRPRQLAMSITKELTRHSLPEIGGAFGGRDHTTVLHACRKVIELRNDDNLLDEDYENIIRLLKN